MNLQPFAGGTNQKGMQHKWLINLILLLMTGFPSLGQGQRFSQYNYTPLQINAAQVAASNNVAFLLGHRVQHYANQVTLQSTAFTGKCPLINKRTGIRWGGVGVSFINSHSDDEQFFKFQRIDAAFAYNFSLSERTFISWGLQGGYYQKSLGGEKFSTGSQYIENTGYDPHTSIGENIQNIRVNYFNAGSGLYFYTTDKGETTSYIGLAAYQVNRPQESFGNTAYKLPVQWVINGGKRLFHNGSWSVTPEIFWIKESSRIWINVGTACVYHFQNNNPLDPIQSGSVDFGMKYALEQAAILSVQFNQPNLAVGFSYDIPVSYAKPISPVRGATEMAIAIKKPIARKKTPKVVHDYSVGQVRHFYEKQIIQVERDKAETTEGRSRQSDSLSLKDTAQIEEKVAFSLRKTFQFAFNDIGLTPEAKAYFDDFVVLMKLNPDLQLKVIGHTDNIGKERTNIKLSQDRAQAVKDYLTDKGIDKKRITVEGKGSSEPLFPNDTPSNQARNRRVELVIHK